MDGTTLSRTPARRTVHLRYTPGGNVLPKRKRRRAEGAIQYRAATWAYGGIACRALV